MKLIMKFKVDDLSSGLRLAEALRNAAIYGQQTNVKDLLTHLTGTPITGAEVK